MYRLGGDVRTRLYRDALMVSGDGHQHFDSPMSDRPVGICRRERGPSKIPKTQNRRLTFLNGFDGGASPPPHPAHLRPLGARSLLCQNSP